MFPSSSILLTSTAETEAEITQGDLWSAAEAALATNFFRQGRMGRKGEVKR